MARSEHQPKAGNFGQTSSSTIPKALANHMIDTYALYK